MERWRGKDFASLLRQSLVQKQPVMRGMLKCFRSIVFLGQVVQIEVGLLSSGLSVCRSVLRAEGKTLQYFHVTSTLANCVWRCSNILPQFMWMNSVFTAFSWVSETYWVLQYFHMTSTPANCLWRCSNILPPSYMYSIYNTFTWLPPCAATTPSSTWIESEQGHVFKIQCQRGNC